MPMDPELKAKWVAALRSGEYKQGRRALRSVANEFCCLGVLCEVAGVPSQLDERTDIVYTYTFKCGDVQTKSSAFICGDLFSSIGSYDSVLISMNDVSKNTFCEIADYIEEHY